VKEFVKAVACAAEWHKDQRRKDADSTPYINHPVQVALMLIEAGVYDEEILCAAVLHDVMEDCDVSFVDIAYSFNVMVALMVRECTDDKGLNKAERKAAQIAKVATLSPDAKLIKVADKICNMRDIIYNPPYGWTKERKQGYFDFARKVFDAANIDNQYLIEQFEMVWKYGK